jgi:3-hydroxy-3-methylglutaryl CoA synthase
MTDYGITGYGAYIPRLRLDRACIAAAHAWMAPSLRGLARGRRAFCSWDEDAITMAVEAARDCVAPAQRASLDSLTLVSTTLPYADLHNSSIVAGALGLPAGTHTADLGGSQRAGISALAAGLRGQQGQALVVAADRPRAKPASVQEMTYGAGAAAFSLGAGRPIARLLGSHLATAPFVDHFRAAGAAHDYMWEERWIRDEGYAKLIPPVVKAALLEAGTAIGEIDMLVLASPLKGAAAALARQIGFGGRLADSLDDGCGYAGAAHPLLMLAGALPSLRAGQKLLLVGFGQGAEAIVLQATEAIDEYRPQRGVEMALADSVATGDYLRMASFYGEIDLDWGMRGEKTGKAALTTQYREAGQLGAFVAGRCGACGTVQFPRLAYCVNPDCAAPAGQFEDFPLTEVPATVLTFTADWLSYHPAPPLYVGFVQFDAGARLLMEIVDVGAAGLDVGTPVRMVFRIKEPDRIRGYNRYFWKATPVAAHTAGETG